MNVKTARTDYPIQSVLARRYSAYCFTDKLVDGTDLRSIFEAARWAASAFNEQPWRYIVAERSDTVGFQRLLGCLVPANQDWAQHAAVLAMGLSKSTFSQNGAANGVALHDLGLANASLTLEAVARGLNVHPMAGIDADAVRERYAVPDNFTPLVGLAIGYAAVPKDQPTAEKDRTPRSRHPLAMTVFGDRWEQPAF